MNTKFSRVIVVCGSNTLRSPTFEKALQLALSKAGLTHIQVTSAGADGTIKYNQPADEKNAEYLLQYHNIRLDGHRSRYIADVKPIDTDLIIVTSGRVDRMAVQCLYNPKAFHYFNVREGKEIDSPYCGGTHPDFRGMKQQIDEAVAEVITFLQNQD